MTGLTGQGIVTVDTIAYEVAPGETVLEVEKVEYTFVVPEPSTFVVSVPLALLLARRRLRRKVTGGWGAS